MIGSFERLLLRGLAATHRSLLRADRVLREVSVFVSTPEAAAYSTREYYAGATKYTRTSAQQAGLFPFEERALAGFFPKPPARLLVPGAGAGREMLALALRGYLVDGFDPVPELVAASERLLVGRESARVWRQSLEEWSESDSTVTYDGIVVGWALWTHMLRSTDRLAALRGFLRACPAGPVLLSFWRSEPVFDHEEAPLGEAMRRSEDRLQRALGSVRRHLLGLPEVEPGTQWRGGMFVHVVGEHELRREAALTGYKVAWHERDADRYPNAILCPENDAAAGAGAPHGDGKIGRRP